MHGKRWGGGSFPTPTRICLIKGRKGELSNSRLSVSEEGSWRSFPRRIRIFRHRFSVFHPRHFTKRFSPSTGKHTGSYKPLPYVVHIRQYGTLFAGEKAALGSRRQRRRREVAVKRNFSHSHSSFLSVSAAPIPPTSKSGDYFSSISSFQSLAVTAPKQLVSSVSPREEEKKVFSFCFF